MEIMEAHRVSEFEKSLKLKIKMGHGLGNLCIRIAPQNQKDPTCMDL